MSETIKVVGGGLMTSSIARIYINETPMAMSPWWLSEPGIYKGVRFVTADGYINARGGDPSAEYGIRPVLAVQSREIKKGEQIDLVDICDYSRKEPFTCIWRTQNGETWNSMIFCDRIIELSPFSKNGSTEYRGSDAEKIVQAFIDMMDGRLIIRKGSDDSDTVPEQKHAYAEA